MFTAGGLDTVQSGTDQLFEIGQIEFKRVGTSHERSSRFDDTRYRHPILLMPQRRIDPDETMGACWPQSSFSLPRTWFLPSGAFLFCGWIEPARPSSAPA